MQSGLAPLTIPTSNPSLMSEGLRRDLVHSREMEARPYLKLTYSLHFDPWSPPKEHDCNRLVAACV